MNNVNADLHPNSESYIYTPSHSSFKFPFYLNTCGHFYAGKKYTVERDSLQGYLIIFTVSGKGFLKYAEKSFTIYPGQVFIINSSDNHYYSTLELDWEIKWFRFDGPASESFYQQIYPNSFDIFTIKDIYGTNEIFEDIIRIARNPVSTSDMQLSILTAHILTQLCKNKLEISTSSASSQSTLLVEKAIDFLRSEYTRNISLDNICKHLHISSFYFSRTFKKHTGMSPHSYLTKIRINHSKELLCRTDMAVGEISMLAGYENVNNFIRSFKIFTGMTPLKYRKMWAE